MEIERLREPCPKWAANEIARLRAELAATQTIATRERAEADVQIERRIEVEAELAAAKARTGKCGMEGHNEPCYYCGEPCNSLVGNSSRWPVALCHADDPGVVKWHHTGCVMERLVELAAKDARIAFRVPALTPDQEVHLKTLEPQPYDPDTMIGAPSPAGPDGKSLAVIYCMERAEEDVKLLREALEDMIAVAEGRFDGNPHADIDALAKARAARDHSLAGEKS